MLLLLEATKDHKPISLSLRFSQAIFIIIIYLSLCISLNLHISLCISLSLYLSLCKLQSTKLAVFIKAFTATFSHQKESTENSLPSRESFHISSYIFIPIFISSFVYSFFFCYRIKMRSMLVLGVVNFLILVHGFSFSSAILDPVDFLALQSIRKSLEDMPGSNYFSSWDFTSDPCNFAGVYCSGEKVVALNLGDPRAGAPGLSGRLNPAIGKLTDLAEFTVVPGRIMGKLPASLSQLKNLRFLAVSRNFISGEIPAALGELRGLRTLDLSYNQLAGNIPPAVGSLPALTNVILCHNHLSGSMPSFASQSLTRLDLKHNDLSGSIEPGSLPSSLQYLSLSWNRLTGPVDRLLPRLNQLNYLDLSLNQFTGPIPGCVFGFPITNLQLERNLFSGPVQPENEVSIPTVDLSHNMLYGQVSPLFAAVENLYLNNNRFTGSVPTTFVDRLMTGDIRLLYLQHNFLTGMSINPTAEIPLSSSLCLQYNCMVPPVETPCPINAGTQKTRPTTQCMEWKG